MDTKIQLKSEKSEFYYSFFSNLPHITIKTKSQFRETTLHHPKDTIRIRKTTFTQQQNTIRNLQNHFHTLANHFKRP